ncbi:MAG: ABC transporter substrate-binding protein [Candidatus Limnocylindria bacterium]
MTRTDTLVVGTLVLLLAIVAGLIGGPALAPTATTPSASPTVPPAAEPRPYREGVLGGPTSVSPLTARTQADRDLVALVFSGLMRNGPGATVVPDLAERWTVDDAGAVWTVTLREGATWHDGEPVTVEDVLFTFRTLQDPAYTGPSAGSWRDVTVAAPTERTVTFTLANPLGGFLQALTQPIAPVHLLGGVPVEQLPDDPFGLEPVGSGPFALVELSPTSATLIPVGGGPDGGDEPDPSAAPTDSLASARPTRRPDRPIPYLDGIEFHFALDAASLITAFKEGELDAISGLAPGAAVGLAASSGGRLMRYPGTTLTTVLLNQRPDHPEFRDPGVRNALLSAIDRRAIVDEVFAGAAVTATTLVPPSDELFDPEADPGVSFDAAAAQKALEAASWTKKDDGWYLDSGKEPLRIEVLSPTQDTSPALYATAAAIVAAWQAIDIDATHVPLAAGELTGSRLSKGAFDVAVADVTIGMDPDPYPLLASSQTLTGGSNVSGIQDTRLDALLTAARKPATGEARAKAYSALQAYLATARYVLPIAFADEVVVVRDTLEGAEIRQVDDPSGRFWDVLTWRLAEGR